MYDISNFGMLWILFIFNPNYISLPLGLLFIYKFRITGILLLLHALIIWMYDINYQYEQTHVSELIKSVYGAFYEENLFHMMIYGIISIPIILVFGLILDKKFFRK